MFGNCIREFTVTCETGRDSNHKTIFRERLRVWLRHHFVAGTSFLRQAWGGGIESVCEHGEFYCAKLDDAAKVASFAGVLRQPV